jgi:hypothetical protein
MIPTQKQTDLTKPETHLVWALQNMPVAAGVGAVTNVAVLQSWAKHLWEVGVVHRDYLELLADEDGYIHVSQLPRQAKRLAPPVRGPRHGFNNASRWVEMSAPDPEPVVIQDPRLLTAQEREAQLSVYAELGLIPQPTPGRDTASVE